MAAGVAEVDRVHEAAVDGAGVGNAVVGEALRDLHVRGARDVEGQVVQVADALRVGRGVGHARGPHEEGEQAAIAHVKEEVGLVGHVQVGLLEHKAHAQHAVVEGQGGLAVRADHGNVMQSLALDLGHGRLSFT